jgi:hypothetical protein
MVMERSISLASIILIAIQPPKVLSRRPSFDAITVVLGFESVGSAVIVAQPDDVAVVAASRCATIRGHIDLGDSPIQHRHIHVFDINAGFDPIDAIGTTQAGIRRKRGYIQRKKRSFGFLHFLADPNSAKLKHWSRNESRLRNRQGKIGSLAARRKNRGIRFSHNLCEDSQ